LRGTSGTANSLQTLNKSREIPLILSSTVCNYTARVASFHVSVDAEGYVLSTNWIGPFEDPGKYFAANANEANLLQESLGLLFLRYGRVHKLCPYEDFTWHNDSFTSDWMNTIFAASQGSNELVNLSYSVPKRADIAPLVQNTMEQPSAILLIQPQSLCSG
jgi:hypothetical protein